MSTFVPWYRVQRSSTPDRRGVDVTALLDHVLENRTEADKVLVQYTHARTVRRRPRRDDGGEKKPPKTWGSTNNAHYARVNTLAYDVLGTVERKKKKKVKNRWPRCRCTVIVCSSSSNWYSLNYLTIVCASTCVRITTASCFRFVNNRGRDRPVLRIRVGVWNSYNIMHSGGPLQHRPSVCTTNVVDQMLYQIMYVTPRT